MRVKIELITMTDCSDFVRVVAAQEGKITLENNDGFCVNAKSLLGALAATEWDNLWVNSDNDIYRLIERWIVN